MIQIITNVENGFWYTVKMLFTNPAAVIKGYLNGNTAKYYHPVRYLVIWMAVSAFLMLTSGVYDNQQDSLQDFMHVPKDDDAVARQKMIKEELKKYLNFIPLIIVPFISLASFWLYRKKQLNYAEHLIANAFIYGQLAIIGLLTTSIMSFYPKMILWAMPISLTTTALYLAYTHRNLFDIKTPIAIAKGFLITICGFLFFFISIIYFLFIGGITYVVITKVFL